MEFSLLKPHFILWVTCLCMGLLSCADIQKDTCEEDRENGNWQQVIDSNSCTAAQKAEAYLALGGFDYFKFILQGNASLTTILDLNESNWQSERFDRYEAARELMAPIYETGTDEEKTIYLLASFLSLYTYLSGNLDNGNATGTTAFDGVFTDGEIAAFTGGNLTSNTEGTGDGTTITKSDYVQFQISNGSYYIYDTVAEKFYEDTLADGSPDGAAITDPIVLAGLIPGNWVVANQVMYLEKLINPFGNSTVSTTTVTTFSNRLIGYIKNVENGLNSLGISSTSTGVKEMQKLRVNLDNGASCDTLNSNPGLRIIEAFAAKAVESAPAGNDYRSSPTYATADLKSLGEQDTTTDTVTGAPDGLTINIRMLYRHKSSATYIPYWKDDSTTDVSGPMTIVKDLFPNGSGKTATKGDNYISFSEVLCFGDLASKK